MTKPLTDEELAFLSRLHTQASDSPWAMHAGNSIYDKGDFLIGYMGGAADDGRFEDAALIVSACNALPALIAEVRQWRASGKQLVAEAIAAALEDLKVESAIKDSLDRFALPEVKP